LEFTRETLRAFQAEPLDQKIQRTLAKVSEWYQYWEGNVYVSFSGGKDSTVLADICAKWCSFTGGTLYLVFVNTGLQFPEIQKHVKVFADWLRETYGIDVQLDIVRPTMRFDEVICAYGYPVISKRIGDVVSCARKNVRDGKMDTQRVRQLIGDERRRDGKPSKFNAKKWAPLLYTDFETSAKCCDVMKKRPFKEYQKKTGRMPLVATMAYESTEREKRWLKLGCNAFHSSTPMSTPMAFWTEQDVLAYIATRNLPTASVYGDILEYHFGECLSVCFSSFVDGLQGNSAGDLALDRVYHLQRRVVAQVEEFLCLVKVEKSHLAIQVKVHEHTIGVG
jgi:3'-phosphoadenosine 5'-phosphosulfate sulfotransferase (PAPS reductase)/FAD synthetase